MKVSKLLYADKKMIIEDFWKMTKECYDKLDEEGKKYFLKVMFPDKNKKEG